MEDKTKKEMWAFITTLSLVSAVLAVASFFYFYGYRLNGELTVKRVDLSLSDPFLYIIAAALIGGASLTMLSHEVEKNDYRLTLDIVKKTLGKLVVSAVVGILVSLLIL